MTNLRRRFAAVALAAALAALPACGDSSQPTAATTAPTSPATTAPLPPSTVAASTTTTAAAPATTVVPPLDPPALITDDRYCGWHLEFLRERQLADLAEFPALLAVITGDVEGLTAELAAGADPNQGSSVYALNPLTAAIESDCDEATDAVLAAGADVNAQPSDGYTPLQLAALRNNHALIARLLEAGAEVGILGPEGTTALGIAAGESDLEAVRLLVEGGADIEQLAVGSTPIDIAAAAGWVEGIEYLAARGADLSTALFHAVIWEQPEAVRALIDVGAPVSAEAPDGPYAGRGTPLDLAEELGFDEIAEILRENGA